jgi:hypothetical protein
LFPQTFGRTAAFSDGRANLRGISEIDEAGAIFSPGGSAIDQAAFQLLGYKTTADSL